VQARAQLTHANEDALLTELMRLPEVIENAAENRAPQVLVHYLQDVAVALHSFYDGEPILTATEELRHARLGLARATQLVLANGLALLGVSAPESM